MVQVRHPSSCCRDTGRRNDLSSHPVAALPGMKYVYVHNIYFRYHCPFLFLCVWMAEQNDTQQKLEIPS